MEGILQKAGIIEDVLDRNGEARNRVMLRGNVDGSTFFKELKANRKRLSLQRQKCFVCLHCMLCSNI